MKRIRSNRGSTDIITTIFSVLGMFLVFFVIGYIFRSPVSRFRLLFNTSDIAFGINFGETIEQLQSRTSSKGLTLTRDDPSGIRSYKVIKKEAREGVASDDYFADGIPYTLNGALDKSTTIKTLKIIIVENRVYGISPFFKDSNELSFWDRFCGLDADLLGVLVGEHSNFTVSTDPHSEAFLINVRGKKVFVEFTTHNYDYCCPTYTCPYLYLTGD